MIKAETTFSLKDQLFNDEKVRKLAKQLRSADPRFPEKRFVKDAQAAFPALALKERIQWLVDALTPILPANFLEAIDVLQRALPPPLDPDREDDDFGEFIWVVPGEYVATHGCVEQYLDTSLVFLREATMRFSSEGAVRPFLKSFPEQTVAFLRDCTEDPNYHVRRWASEGTRPYLPWAMRVVLPLPSIIDILDRLHGDSTRYVTRSVANNLNDISKLDASLVLSTVQRWKKEGQQEEKELNWMTRHALRTLLKKDHAEALVLIGYATEPAFEVSKVEASEVVVVGEALLWRCRLKSRADQRLKIGLRLHFLKANGQYSSKVFVVKDVAAESGQVLTIEKQIPLRPMTTRVLYPGTHFIEIVVNGVGRTKRAFELQAGDDHPVVA